MKSISSAIVIALGIAISPSVILAAPVDSRAVVSRTIFDDIQDSAPRTIFDDIQDSAPVTTDEVNPIEFTSE